MACNHFSDLTTATALLASSCAVGSSHAFDSIAGYYGVGDMRRRFSTRQGAIFGGHRMTLIAANIKSWGEHAFLGCFMGTALQEAPLQHYMKLASLLSTSAGLPKFAPRSARLPQEDNHQPGILSFMQPLAPNSRNQRQNYSDGHAATRVLPAQRYKIWETLPLISCIDDREEEET